MSRRCSPKRWGNAMSDDIRGMTAELAADPDSLIFLDLGEALRRRGQLDAAAKVARTGLARYPELARAHDLCARILCDRGEPDRAFEAWVTALQFDGSLVSAHKGLGFLYYRAGDLAAAEKHLAYAAQADPDDPGTLGALERVQADGQAGRRAGGQADSEEAGRRAGGQADSGISAEPA